MQYAIINVSDSSMLLSPYHIMFNSESGLLLSSQKGKFNILIQLQVSWQSNQMKQGNDFKNHVGLCKNCSLCIEEYRPYEALPLLSAALIMFCVFQFVFPTACRLDLTDL